MSKSGALGRVSLSLESDTRWVKVIKTKVSPNAGGGVNVREMTVLQDATSWSNFYGPK